LTENAWVVVPGRIARRRIAGTSLRRVNFSVILAVLATGRLAYGTVTTVPAGSIELAEAEKSLLAERRAKVT